MIYKVEKNILYVFRIYQGRFFTVKNIDMRKNNQSCIKNVVSTDFIFLKTYYIKAFNKKKYFFSCNLNGLF